MDILKPIFVFFLLLFPLGETVRFNLGSFSIKPVDIAALILFAVWVPRAFKKTNIRSNKLFIPIFSVVAIMCISLVINIRNFSASEVFIAFSYVLRWILYASLFFIVKNFSEGFKEKIAYILLGIGAMFAFFGFIQYFFYSNLRNLYYLGWDEHIHRMFSTFLDPNFAGAFFVLYLFFLLGILLFLLNNNKTKQTWFIGLISVFTLISVFLTYSRSALIMLLVTTVIFFVLARKIKWIFVIILISIVFISISSKSFNVENINLFRIASTEARLGSARTAIEIIKNNPIVGVGFNTYRYAQVKYGFKSILNINVSHADAGTDNSFLFILATTGIIGLFFYLNLLCSILKKSYLSYKLSKENNIQKYIAVAATASLSGIIINSFFINSLFYSFIMVWMWILLGLISKNDP